MKTIILAAGTGRRLNAAVPKCMVEVGGRSILRRQLEAFQAAGLIDHVLVLGFQADLVRAHLAGRPGRFTFVHNPRYAETNTLYSLYLARAHLAGGAVYANADVLFDRRLPPRLAERIGTSCLAVRVGPCGAEEVKVVADPGGRIRRIGKELPPAAALGEFVGVARFEAGAAAALEAGLVECVEGESRLNDYFETALDRLCDRWPMHAVDVTDLPCCEIDFPADLEHARREVAPRLLEAGAGA